VLCACMDPHTYHAFGVILLMLRLKALLQVWCVCFHLHPPSLPDAHLQVEMEIAAQAHTFLGTAISSNTHSVAAQRAGRGVASSRTMFLDDPAQSWENILWPLTTDMWGAPGRQAGRPRALLQTDTTANILYCPSLLWPQSSVHLHANLIAGIRGPIA
jgi:hypothetical protein